MSTSWERVSDLQRHCRAILLYWAGTPDQRVGEGNRRYLTMRLCAAARELHRERGERYVAKGQQLVPHSQYERLFSDTSKLRGAHVWFKNRDDLWWLGIIHEVGSAGRPSIIRFLDDPGPVKIILQPALYSTDPDARRFSWCLQRHKASGSAAGLQRRDEDSAS